MANTLGELFKYDPSHPTGHYKLILSDPYQFMLAQKLQVCCFVSQHTDFFAPLSLLHRTPISITSSPQAQSNQESRIRASQSLFDLSQRGNGQALRNTFINGVPVRVSGTSKLPMEVRDCTLSRFILSIITQSVLRASSSWIIPLSCDLLATLLQ